MRNLAQALTLTSAAMRVRSSSRSVIEGFNPLLWLDPESNRPALTGGTATMFQDPAGTTAVTAVGQVAGMVKDRSPNLRHARQNTVTARPLLEGAAGSPLMLRFDGVDDMVSLTAFAAGSLPSNACVYIVYQRNAADVQGSLFSNGVNGFSLSYNQYGPAGLRTESPINANANFFVNGSLLGGTSTPSRAMLFDALPGGVRRLVEVTNVNLAGFTGLTIGGGTMAGYNCNGNYGAVLILPAQSDASRATIRQALAGTYQVAGVI